MQSHAAFAIQPSRPQPITANPINFYKLHWIWRKVCLNLREQCCDSNRHMLMIVCARELRAHNCVLADLQVIPWLARCHVWLAACRFHHIAPETETDLVASHPQVSLLLFLHLPLSFSLCLSCCPTELSFEPSVGWHWFCLAGRAVGKHFDWRENKAHAAIFEAAVLHMTV